MPISRDLFFFFPLSFCHDDSLCFQSLLVLVVIAHVTWGPETLQFELKTYQLEGVLPVDLSVARTASVLVPDAAHIFSRQDAAVRCWTLAGRRCCMLLGLGKEARAGVCHDPVLYAVRNQHLIRLTVTPLLAHTALYLASDPKSCILSSWVLQHAGHNRKQYINAALRTPVSTQCKCDCNGYCAVQL